MQRRRHRPDNVIANEDGEYEDGKAEHERIDRAARQRMCGAADRVGGTRCVGCLLEGQANGGTSLVKLIEGFLQGFHQAVPFDLAAADFFFAAGLGDASATMVEAGMAAGST